MNFEKKKGHPSSVILAELLPQNVLSPEGRCVYASPVRVQLFLLMFYFVRKWTLKKKGHPSIVILAKLFPQNVLSPEGICITYPVGVQLFILMFYFGLGNTLWKKRSPE